MGRCTPSRASLITGLYAHQVGLGHLTGDGKKKSGHEQKPGFIGQLSPVSLTIAEGLSKAGYHCIWSGKWHMGYTPVRCSEKWIEWAIFLIDFANVTTRTEIARRGL